MAARQGGPPPAQGVNSIPASGGPRGPPPSAPSGPSFAPPPPQTPLHSRVPAADELPVVGHGDKVKREAGELVEDVKMEKDRGERYERDDRDRDRERERRHRHRDEDGDRYDRKEERWVFPRLK